jgi:hypothetical protein
VEQYQRISKSNQLFFPENLLQSLSLLGPDINFCTLSSNYFYLQLIRSVRIANKFDYDVIGKLLEGNLHVFTLIRIPHYLGAFEEQCNCCALVFLLLIFS